MIQSEDSQKNALIAQRRLPMTRIILLLLLVMLFIVMVPLLVPTERWRQLAEHQLSDATNLSVSIGELSLTVLPQPRLQTDSVVVRDRYGELLLQGETVSAVLDLTSIFSTTPELQNLSFNGVDIYLGRLLDDSTLGVLSIAGGGRVKRQNRNWLFEHWHLKLFGGEVQLHAQLTLPEQGSKLELQVIANEELPLQLNRLARLLTTHQLTMQGELLPELDILWEPSASVPWLVQGKLALAALSIAKNKKQKLRLAHFRSSVHLTQGDYRLSNLQLLAYSGKLRSKELTLLMPAASPWIMQGDVHFSHLQLSALNRDLMQSSVPISGFAGGDLQVHVKQQGEASVTGPIKLTDLLWRFGKAKQQRQLAIDDMQAELNYTPTTLDLNNIQMKLYGGVVKQSSVKLRNLTSGKRNLRAKVKASGIRLAQLLPDVTGQKKVKGQLSTTLSIRSSGKIFSDKLRINGPVHLDNTLLKQVKIEGSTRLFLNSDAKNRQGLLVKRLDTNLLLKGKNIYLQKLNMDSDFGEAEGELSLLNYQMLDGEITLARLANSTLTIGGTVENPSIWPAKSTLIGGVLGSLLGGPAGGAIGVGIGGAAGKFISDLFGGSKKQ